jgi:hypothetical protein
VNHIGYILEALANRKNEDYDRPFWLYHVDEIEPEPGDILCKNRAGTTWTYGGLEGDRLHKADDGTWEVTDYSGKSHGDIVVKKYAKDGNRYIETIGGNTRDLGTNGKYDTADTVGRKIWRLPPENSSGHLVMVNEDLSDASQGVFDPSEDFVFAFVRLPKLGLAFSGGSGQAVA